MNMHLLTYGPEVQAEAMRVVETWDAINMRAAQTRIDEEGCGAFFGDCILDKPMRDSYL